MINLGMGSKAPEPKLALFAKAFSKLFRGKTKHACYENTSLYKVYLAEEQQQKSNFKGSFQNKMSPGVTTASPPAKKRVLNYWCFSTGLAVEEIKGLGVRSIVLTSGTLSPMASFKEDLRVPFPIELENPHVIREREQIWVGMLTAGPSGKELNSSFAQRDLGYIKDELGNTILAICQTMVGQRPMSSSIAIPQGPELKGGVLVFFPSYGAMESCRKHWFESGLWAKLKTTIGNVVVESKGSGGESSQASIGRSNNVNAAAKGNFFSGEASTIKPDENTPESAIQEFENAIQTTGGKCILMAVCRGKMSEGIDFRDKKGRVVIITGIPYAPHMDPWVVLKREYLDSRLSGVVKSSSQLAQGGVTTGITKAGPLLLGPHPYGRPINSTPYVSVTSQQITAAAGASPGLPAGVGNISGQTWYDQSAMRAVNQALGRVIRHKDDWGAIFFLDSRFQQPNKIAQLSKWVRPTVKKYPQLPPALVDFRAFITKAMNDPILTPVPKANAPARTFSIPKYIPHASMIAPEPQSTNHPSRAVTIPASALGSNRASMGDFGLSGEFGEVDYVDPSLLMTQQSERSGRTDNAFGLTMSKSSFVDDVYSQPSSQTSDIDSIYKSAKQARPAIPLQKKSLSTALGGRDNPTSKSALRDVWERIRKWLNLFLLCMGLRRTIVAALKVSNLLALMRQIRI